jgi:superfamily II DNA or RNA helicase/SOS-response transcriptional repressor LexA
VTKQTIQHLITGGDDPFLPKLLDAINSAAKINITVAFIRESGLFLIFEALMDALKRNVEIRVLTGDYLNITDPKALRHLMLLQMAGAEVRVFESKNRQSFHMKAYIFTFSDNHMQSCGCSYIGSSNITNSALKHGLEWNLKVVEEENPERFKEICKKFEEIYSHPNTKLLSNEWIDVYQQKIDSQPVMLFPDSEENEQLPPPEPNAIQNEALKALKQTRFNGYRRGLVVMATGLGKTWLAAFDSLELNSKKVLFVAHREEILDQAEYTFVRIRPDSKVGRYTGTKHELNTDMLFASIQTLGRKHHLEKFARDHFDYIIVDEFHHAAARTYQQLLAHFNPRFLLGLTATPERTDQADIMALCDDNLVYRRDMFDGIRSGLLCSFHYYGLADKEVNYQAIPWRNGKFDPNLLLTQLATKARAQHALIQWEKHRQVRTLAFCISTKHADYMADYFTNKGYRAVSVHSKSSVRRNDALSKLENGEIDVVFSVDLFNEGVDLPSIDTVLMLRPSESKIIFLQQLGRGLRTNLEKEKLIVLDFIGNHISFFRKPEALFNIGISKSERREFVSQIENNKLPLPDGCFVNYDIQAIDFLAKLIGGQIETQEELYRSLKDSKGRRPTLAEFYTADGSVQTIRQHYEQWLSFISSEQDISAEENECLQYNEDLFKEIEITNLNKSYKIVLLEALMELDGFKKPISTMDLAKQSFSIIQRRRVLLSDLPDNFRTLKQLEEGDARRWHSYWKGNPIKAWIGGNKKTDQSFFKVEGNQFIFQGDVPESKMDVFLTFVRELIDYRYMQYEERPQENNQNQSRHGAEIININEARKVEIPYFSDLKIACGYFKSSLHDEESVQKISLPEYYGRLDSARHFIAHAAGNSMDGGKNPIQDGDYLLLESITPDRAGSISNQVIAIERQDISGDEQYLLRYVRKLGAGKYQLIANNPDYEPMLATEDMRTFARFKGIIDSNDLEINE